MTTEEAKLQIEYRKDFATPAQIEALDMGLKALDEVERYKKAIGELRTEISEISERSIIKDINGICYGERIANPKEIKEKVLSIIDRYFKK